MSKAAQVSGSRYFEDFAVGDIYKHFRGKTVKESDAVTICNMVLNSASGHFNDDIMSATAIGESIVYGGVTISMVIGLAAQDTAGNAIREIGMDNIKLVSPVKHGDTLYAYSEVLDMQDHDDGGVVRFRHYGVNHDDRLVFQGERTVLMKKRSAK